MIPVTWYLILQLFGSNNFSLQLLDPITDCEQVSAITVVLKTDSVSQVKQNYLDRVKYGVEKRSSNLRIKDEKFFECINQIESDIVLISEEGLWGGYSLTRDGVDQLLTELDILILQKSYGKGVER